MPGTVLGKADSNRADRSQTLCAETEKQTEREGDAHGTWGRAGNTGDSS